MALGMVVVQPQANVPLPASVVTPSNPEENESGAVGAGEPEAPKLNDGITIPEGTGEAPELSGDVSTGNDSEYLDEILYPNPDGFSPDAEMVAQNYFADETLRDRRAQTRIFSATVPAGAFGGATAYDPVMLFPADSDRCELVLKATSTVATTFRIGSDKQSCYTAAVIPTTDPALVLRNHTGPVWVYSTDTTNAFVVSGWAVSK